MNKLQKKLNDRLQKDYNNCIDNLKSLNKDDLIKYCYDIAIIINFYEAINFYLEALNYDLKTREFPIKNSLINVIINYKNNILTYFLNCWKYYRHPEEYSFWYDYNSVIEIVNDCTKELKKELTYERKNI